MAREILFRGKRTDNGEWVTGTPFIFEDRCNMIQAVAVHPDFVDEGNVYYSEGFSVDHETVGQYTGLTDKNGKRIFEGDILHIVSYTCDYDFKTSVGAKYGYTSGLYVDGDFDGGDFNEIGFAFDYWSNEDAEVEVIGNIHDNPELLNGKES